MATESDMHKVFVYGTLKSGEPNHHWFSRDGHQRFLGEATTKDTFPLVIATKYNIPLLLDCPGKGKNIKGEVYEIDDKMLANLDILEDYPKYYSRELRMVKFSEIEQEEKVWIYFIKNYNKALLEKPFLACYSAFGDHGLKYKAEYLNGDDNQEILQVFRK